LFSRLLSSALNRLEVISIFTVADDGGYRFRLPGTFFNGSDIAVRFCDRDLICWLFECFSLYLTIQRFYDHFHFVGLTDEGAKMRDF
jgi:hypothetical protein